MTYEIVCFFIDVPTGNVHWFRSTYVLSLNMKAQNNHFNFLIFIYGGNFFHHSPDSYVLLDLYVDLLVIDVREIKISQDVA